MCTIKVCKELLIKSAQLEKLSTMLPLLLVKASITTRSAKVMELFIAFRF